MAKHFYLKMKPPARAAHLETCTDDDLIILQCDLHYEKKHCDLLEQEIVQRQLTYDPEFHILPDAFFPGNRRWSDSPKRLPKRLEYAWKRGTFMAFKYSIFWIGPVIYGIETENDPLAGISIFFYVTSIFVPLFICWTNFFYQPLQYTLVRPFNARKFSRPLKRFILRNIGLRCQGVGLSDRELKPDAMLTLYHRLRIPIAIVGGVFGGSLAGPALLVAILTTWIRPSLRRATILAPSGFLHLNRLLNRPRIMTAQHFFCGGQCFNVRSIDAGWKYALQFLVNRSDFIIVDLSNVGPNSEWELEYLRMQDRLKNCLPICQLDCKESADRFRHLFPTPVLIYDCMGKIVSEDRIEERVQQALTARKKTSPDGLV